MSVGDSSPPKCGIKDTWDEFLSSGEPFKWQQVRWVLSTVNRKQVLQ